MKKARARVLGILAVSVGLALVVSTAAVHSVSAGGPLDGTPPPAATPVPTPPDGGNAPGDTGNPVVNTVTSIIHRLEFPFKTIGDALASLFVDAAEAHSKQLVGEYGVWFRVIGEIVQKPSAGDHARTARGSFPVAAALAPALFILRIALYHWSRLLGEDDSAARAAGDILTALVLAVICGSFLDLVVRLSWWMTGAVMGETGEMAIGFVKAMSFETIIENLKYAMVSSMFLGILMVAVQLGGLVAVAALLMAFVAANAGLFLLAVLGPSIAVASAVPQMRWLRSLWIKAVTVIALLPLVAGGVFKAATHMATLLEPGGLLSLFIRLMWLWGAAGALLSLAGIVGRLTISTTTDAVGQMVKGAQAIISSAALAATGVGAVGAVGGLAGGAAGTAAAGGVAGGAEAAGAGAGAAGLAGGGGEAASLASAGAHLGSAQKWSLGSTLLGAFGQRGAANLARGMSGYHGLAARRAEVSARMARFGGGGPSATADSYDVAGFKVTGDVREQLLDGYGGSPKAMDAAVGALGPLLEARGHTLAAFASSAPYQTGLMARIYQGEKDSLSQEDPLGDVVQRAGLDRNILGPG